MHTDGYVVEDWARLPREEYLLHFEWVVRSHAQRQAKLKRYDRVRYGFGKFFESYYLPEDQPSGMIEYRPLGPAYDALADAYHASRLDGVSPERDNVGDVCRAILRRFGIGIGTNSLKVVPADRQGVRPQLDREVAYDAADLI